MSTARKLADSPHQPTGTWIRRAKRHAIYARDGHACVYCGRDLRAVRPADVTLDHVAVRRRGGHDHSPQNLVTACRACNCRRQDMPLSRFADEATRARIRTLLATPLAAPAATTTPDPASLAERRSAAARKAWATRRIAVPV